MEATADHESKDRHVLEVGTIRLQIELLRPFAKLTQGLAHKSHTSWLSVKVRLDTPACKDAYTKMTFLRDI